MKSTEVIEQLKAEPTDTDEVPDEYEDDDFWEAIDLLETCRKSLLAVLRYNGDDLNMGRNRLLNNLSDDIGMFLGHFVEVNDNSEEE